MAKKQGIPPYNVLGGAVLKQLAKRRPLKLEALGTVDGMSQKKISDYGDEIIKARDGNSTIQTCHVAAGVHERLGTSIEVIIFFRIV